MAPDGSGSASNWIGTRVGKCIIIPNWDSEVRMDKSHSLRDIGRWLPRNRDTKTCVGRYRDTRPEESGRRASGVGSRVEDSRGIGTQKHTSGDIETPRVGSWGHSLKTPAESGHTNIRREISGHASGVIGTRVGRYRDAARRELESGIGNRESGIGNRESGIGNRDMPKSGHASMIPATFGAIVGSKWISLSLLKATHRKNNV